MSGSFSAVENTYLSDSQRDQYWEDGFLFPIRVLSLDEASVSRAELESLENNTCSDSIPRPLSQYLRVHSECVLPMAANLALHPAVLNAVESILGPNIMVWGAEYFIKEAKADSIVSMHQDLTYWGFGETSDQVTAWIALSPSTIESGCMDLVRGSHKNPILEHTDTHAANNLLSRGQEVNVQVEEKDKTSVVLQPGEMSLHHGLTIHGSGANVSDDRRIGFAIRYINPQARQRSVSREYALMARGVDTTQSFIHYAPPSSAFSSTNLAIYEQIREAQNKVLGAGMEAGKDLYENSA